MNSNAHHRPDFRSIEPRFYRREMGLDRFHSFVIGYKDSDLWIGIDRDHFRDEIAFFAQEELLKIRNELEQYILENPLFAASFSPVEVPTSAPPIARIMASAAQRAGTGPMAAVAGAFSEWIGTLIREAFHPDEIVVENGGDLYLMLKEELTISVYAGTSPLSGKLGIAVAAEDSPLGICTSAGTVGPSHSFGKADAVMVACRDTALADAHATAFGNKVRTASDIEAVLSESSRYEEIYAIVIICENKTGIRGRFPLKPIIH